MWFVLNENLSGCKLNLVFRRLEPNITPLNTHCWKCLTQCSIHAGDLFLQSYNVLYLFWVSFTGILYSQHTTWHTCRASLVESGGVMLTSQLRLLLQLILVCLFSSDGDSEYKGNGRLPAGTLHIGHARWSLSFMQKKISSCPWFIYFLAKM